MNRLLAYDPRNPTQAVYRIWIFSAGYTIVFGLFCCGSPLQALLGLWQIFCSPAALITDYIEVGGMGAAFLNAGLAMLFAAVYAKWVHAPIGGLSLAVGYIVAGFALFGKTIPNMLPILTGGWLYARYRGEPFANHIYTSMFATCLGPMVHHAAHFAPIPSLPLRIALGVALGVLIGFATPAVAALTASIHKGMLVYNVGLAAGMVCLAMVAGLKNFGWEFAAVSGSWHTGSDLLLGGYLVLLYLFLIGAGWLLNGRSFTGLAGLRKYSGQSPSDYVRLTGLPVTLMNMGILGFMSTAYVLAVGGALNGPTIGGIFTVVGFGAFCLHYYNVIWPVVGIVLLSLVSVWSLNEPGILLAVLFSTAICPIAGRYGELWGIAAGMVHVSIVRQTAVNYGWLNLYNNGFAAGLTCIVLLPLIALVEKEHERRKAEKAHLAGKELAKKER